MIVGSRTDPGAGRVVPPPPTALRGQRWPVGQLLEAFPPRPTQRSWEATGRPRDQVQSRLLASPLLDGLPYATRRGRVIALGAVLDWLSSQPGQTWQDRWIASGAEAEHGTDWRALVAALRGRVAADPKRAYADLGPGLLALICGDVVRPGVGWLLTSPSPRKLATSLALTRDHEGFARLEVLCRQAAVSTGTTGPALDRVAAIVAAKGGTVADITVGDCLQLLQIATATFRDGHYNSPFFYQLLHSMGIFGPAAPPTIRAFNTRGQLSAEQLVDRYAITCRPVRDLLVDYLRERQTRLDYSTLEALSRTLANLFWRDIELHHPGIDSIRLSREVAAAWKQRLSTKTSPTLAADGSPNAARSTRISAMQILATVRAFYLDIGEWATDEPARWGPWAAPSPVRSGEISHKKDLDRRKSRMDQRTRERIPILPALVSAVDTERRAAADRLAAAAQTPPGQQFTGAGQQLQRPSGGRRATTRVWTQDPETGSRRDLTLEEHRAFWAWAAIEVLRHTGIRIEELSELSHHDMIQYKLPGTGELIPLLHIAPSKTDIERLLVISPELADVLATIICRVRHDDAVPLVVAYDEHERTWLPPMPLLFQRRFGAEHRPIAPPAIRLLINIAVQRCGTTGSDGRPLRFAPHDFRRIFITDAIMHGMPPHIAQLVAGHRDISATMGYKAVYPSEAINGHRAFIARRRALRPSGEYRTPTEEEWNEFLGHFERRKLSLGTCGRSYATPCIHEHSCIRCPLLRPDPAQRPRLVEIETNLRARINEATRQGWHGEAEGLKVSIAAARGKLTQMDEIAAQHRRVVDLGIPRFADTAGRTVTTPGDPAAGPPTPGRQRS